jgi:hypothetical protein
MRQCSKMPAMRELLRWHFDLTWSLLDLHLDRLTTEECLWEGGPGWWSVRLQEDGTWRADLELPEPDPAPPSSIGWLTWHIGWWWTQLLDGVEMVDWPGDAAGTVAWLGTLRERWIAHLAVVDLAAPSTYPWRDRPDRTQAHVAAWVNGELMKNAAEIGQAVMRLRWERAATSGPPETR